MRTPSMSSAGCSANRKVPQSTASLIIVQSFTNETIFKLYLFSFFVLQYFHIKIQPFATGAIHFQKIRQGSNPLSAP